jgi:drug/metabolite transporter (DMT)-like permease
MGGLFLKYSSSSIDFNKNIIDVLIQIFTNWKFLCGCVCYFLPILIWVYLLKYFELSFIQPLFSLMYITTPFFSYILFGEELGLQRLIGIFLILCGVIVQFNS